MIVFARDSAHHRPTHGKERIGPMYLQFTPWVALVLGLLLGWLLEWLVELLFFRRRRLTCQERLARLETDLAARKTQVKDAHDRLEGLQAELAAQRGGRK